MQRVDQIETVRILDCDFARLTLNATVAQVFELIRKDERGYLCTVNVAILMMMRKDNELRRFIESAFATVADGAPIVWASSGRLPERVTGVDLVHDLSIEAAKTDTGIYLLGATEEIVHEVAERLRHSIPSLHIAGISDGYFNDNETDRIIEDINASGAKILIVAMGVPRQERFIASNWQALNVNLAIGVGGSFDVLAGRRKRAPKFLQVAGLEWAFRLAQEPRRLFLRYLTTNCQFIYLQIRDSLRAR